MVHRHIRMVSRASPAKVGKPNAFTDGLLLLTHTSCPSLPADGLYNSAFSISILPRSGTDLLRQFYIVILGKATTAAALAVFTKEV